MSGVLKEAKLLISLLERTREDYGTKEFIAYLAAYLHAEICDCSEAPEVDDIKGWIECAIEAFEGGAR